MTKQSKRAKRPRTHRKSSFLSTEDEAQAKQEPIRSQSSEVARSSLEESLDITADQVDDYEREHPKQFRARVVEVHKKYVFVSVEAKDQVIDTKDVWLATIARRHLQAKRSERNILVVGDVVYCLPDNEQTNVKKSDLPRCMVDARLSRQSVLARVDPMSQERTHVLASNFDQLIIISSYLAPRVKWGLIDRYLLLAEEQGIPAIIVLNKEDLLTTKPKLAASSAHHIAIYQNLGYEVLSLSMTMIKKGDSAWQQLNERLSGHTSLLSGHSGVGKSSLVNLFSPQIVQDVESDVILQKGRHTTTYASLIKLEAGGFVVDTPGIRSFVLAKREALELTYGFREFRHLVGKCQFRECQHMTEPNCAIKQAVDEKLISPERYKSYIGILTGETGREGREREIE